MDEQIADIMQSEPFTVVKQEWSLMKPKTIYMINNGGESMVVWQEDKGESICYMSKHFS